ncbi:MAG: hypothetical protein E6H57_15690 [Betaproteobacteria bacterium]|nr:MAG: hypothetical protein E6H57_15690 [Betaproteobacteria bacterium]
MPVADTPWYRDREAWRFIAYRYLPWLAGLNLTWELAQLPLYTIWREASAGYVAFAVAHCTVGDILIGAASLALALIAVRAGPLARWRWLQVALIATAAGATYTLVSEWMNTSLRQGWAYSELMPTLELGGLVIGLAPLAQWLVVPPLALYLARRSASR